MEDDRTRVRPVGSGGAAHVGQDERQQPSGATPEIAIPNLELHRELGRGGMAVVWEASDRGFSPPRRVAVKLMGKELSSDAEFRARFEREASIVARFRHDNIVRVHASGEANSVKYIVMEHLPGGTLADRLRTGPVEPLEAMRIAMHLADALQYSHARGIVHRDFKPGNVLFTEEGQPVLSDFGVAKITAADHPDRTRYAAVVGAPRYMAPEQARADEVISDRADVFSFGVTVFEMLTGQLPGGAQGAGGLDRIRNLLTGQPAALHELLHRCLNLDPAARPSARECRDVLSSILAKSERDEPHHVRRKEGRRRTLAYTAALSSVALAVMLGAYVLLGGSRTPPLEGAGAELLPGAAQANGSVAATTLTVRRRPAGARIFIDGSGIAGSTLSLPPGSHRLTAVASGFHGEVRDVEVDGTEMTLEVTLPPVTLPTEEVLSRFYDLAEADVIEGSNVEAIDDPTLREALRIKLLAQRGESDLLRDAEARLSALDAHGDQRAPLVTFLVGALRDNDFSEALVTESLLAASDRGDALASFFIAQAHGSSGNIEAYCRRMSMARAAGWAVAARQLDGDARCERD